MGKVDGSGKILVYIYLNPYTLRPINLDSVYLGSPLTLQFLKIRKKKLRRTLPIPRTRSLEPNLPCNDLEW